MLLHELKHHFLYVCFTSQPSTAKDLSSHWINISDILQVTVGVSLCGCVDECVWE